MFFTHLVYVIIVAAIDESSVLSQTGVFQGCEVVGAVLLVIAMLITLAAICLHIFRCQFGLPAIWQLVLWGLFMITYGSSLGLLCHTFILLPSTILCLAIVFFTHFVISAILGAANKIEG